MPLLEGDEEKVKEGKGLKFLTLNRLLTKLPILLFIQIKNWNQTNTISMTKSLKNFTTI